MRTTIIKVIILIIISFHNQTLSKKLDLQVLKDACTSIGFKTKTEKHGECVLELHKRSDELKLFKVSESNNYNESSCCLIGDSINDKFAANKNRISFFGFNNKQLINDSKYIHTFESFQ